MLHEKLGFGDTNTRGGHWFLALTLTGVAQIEAVNQWKISGLSWIPN